MGSAGRNLGQPMYRFAGTCLFIATDHRLLFKNKNKPRRCQKEFLMNYPSEKPPPPPPLEMMETPGVNSSRFYKTGLFKFPRIKINICVTVMCWTTSAKQNKAFGKRCTHVDFHAVADQPAHTLEGQRAVKIVRWE